MCAVDMLRQLRAVIILILIASFARPAAAQNFGFRGRDFDKVLDRGYTDEELIAEKKLLLDKSKPITWEVLPLIEFPRRRSPPQSPQAPGQPVVAKFSELPQSKIDEAQKRFVDTKLKDRDFSGVVRIARIDPNGGAFTIYAKEPSRAWSKNLMWPHLSKTMWPVYLCQWQSESDRGFHVGENVDIVGKIEDLKEDGKDNTLFLKDVAIASEAAKKKSQ